MFFSNIFLDTFTILREIEDLKVIIPGSADSRFYLYYLNGKLDANIEILKRDFGYSTDHLEKMKII